MVIREILSVSGAEGRTGAVTDVSPDPTEPAPTDLLEFPPLPKQSGGPDAGPGGGPGAGAVAPESAGGIRVVPDAEATARLRITLPTQTPTPSTALRPQANWEDTHEEPDSSVEPFARIAASPASPSTLPSQLAAMTTATMVIPLPPSVRPGSGLLTTTLPPDQAALANAARIGEAFRDTIEEIFGVDLDTVDPADLGLAPQGADQARQEDGYESYDAYGALDAFDSFDRYEEVSGTGAHRAGSGRGAPDRPEPGYAEADYGDGDGSGDGAVEPYAPIAFPRPVPAEVFGGAYGVPTQQAPIGMPDLADAFGQNLRGTADPHRHALALRYLGGIFHDSSGESSYMDPEVLDRGWIPSAFGAVPPDAPTEQLARIPALEVPRGGPVGVIGSASGARAAAVRAAPGPVGVVGGSGSGSGSRIGTDGGTGFSSSSSTGFGGGSGFGAAADDTAVLPVQSVPDPDPEPDPAHGRTGARGAHGPRHDPARRTAAAKRKQGAEKPGETEAAERTGRGRGRTSVIAGLCVAAIALLYGIALLVAGGVLGATVPAGVSVDGIALGGLSPAAARQALQKQLGPQAAAAIAIQVGQTPVGIDPAKAGLSLDVAGTVAAADSGRTNPFTVIPALFGVGHQVQPVVDVDQSALTATLTALADAYDAPLVEGRITFADGQPVVTAPREGRGFDVAAASAAVSSGYLRVSGPIVLPVNTLTPLATPEALQDALEQLARPAVSAPITIVTGGVSTVLTPEQIGAALTIAPNQSGTMVPTLDGALLHADLNPDALAAEQPGVNAGFTVVDGAPQLVPEKDGLGYAPSALSTAVAQVLTATTPAGRTVTVPRGPLPPAFTTADAQALGVQSVLGAATLAVPAAPDRAPDAARAVSLVTGSIVQPGAVWSFDKTVGSPTGGNGFQEAGGGSADGADASGADDLVATAVFDAAFRAGMGDTLHHPNAVYLDRYPVGLDAAVLWPGTDLQWTNSASRPVYLYAAVSNGEIIVDLLGEPAYDQVDVTVSDRQDVVAPSGTPGYGCPAQPAGDGFQVDVTRVLTKDGAQVGTEQFHVTYQPYGGTQCGGQTAQDPTSGSTGSGSVHTTGGGSTRNTPSGGGGGSSSSSGGGSTGGSGGNPPPTSSQPNPAPTDTGVLGGLLH
jgi:vancomycin resistance protein YoaR